jgi:type IV secretory pathway VirB4 component
MNGRSHQLSHRVTTRHLGAAYPFMAEAGLGSRGVQLGVDLFGGPFVYDPWELYAQGLLSNPNMLVIGEVGTGKSALKKSYLLRQMAFGRKAVSINAKREDDRLCQAAGVEPIRLERGGLVRLNPLDARIAGPHADAREIQVGRLRLLRAVIGASLRRELSAEEQAACKQALLAAAERGQPTLPAVAEALLRPSDRAAQALATDRERLAAATREAALALLRLCEDDLAGMFDGPTSGRVDFEAPLVAFDLSAVRDEDGLGILRICAAAFVQHSLLSEPDVRRVVVLDEAWKLLANLATARWLQDSYKLARSHGLQNIAIVHRLSDLTAAGAEGSEQVQLAVGLLKDTQTQVIFQQPPGELARVRELLGLNDVEAEVVSSLRTGTALWRVNRRSFLVRHQLTEEEEWIVDTDQRMASFSGEFSDSEGSASGNSGSGRP